MNDKWIEQHVNKYLEYLIVASDEWSTDLFSPAVRFLSTIPNVSKLIDFRMIYESYDKGYVRVVIRCQLDFKEDVGGNGSIY